jgi:integrase
LEAQKKFTRLLHREIFLHPGTPIHWRARHGKGAMGGAIQNAEVVDSGRLRPASVNKAYRNDKTIRRFWAKACAAAGVKYRYPRQLRHTYASWMLMGGEDIVWLSRQMGHRDVSVTMQRYVKFIPGQHQNAGMKAHAAWLASQNPK